MKIVYLKWKDATFYDRYVERDEKLDLLVIEECGFLVYEDKEKVVFATSYEEKERRWKYVHAIPKVNIIKRRVIKLD